ncbi:hypothetical protein Y1Q_0016939 [Alligator mississippiensis]|uniref:Uncharacterized protein n=1 Tax=Alligator mississippiensis TaxID=8496 RepID=A0A151P5Q4_ALLMI|nr:hypothetical protein Y1Q_0016939 [Alligator mississippiensis]
MDYVRETLVILSVVQNLRKTPECLDQFGEQDHLENSVKKEIMALEEQVKKCFDQMNHSLDEGAKEAIKSQKRIINKLLDCVKIKKLSSTGPHSACDNWPISFVGPGKPIDMQMG